MELGNPEFEFDPAEVDESVITPTGKEVENNIRLFLAGDLEGFDNLAQILDEGLWKAFNAGFETGIGAAVITQGKAGK